MLEYAFKIMLQSSRNVLQIYLLSQNEKLLPITLALLSNHDINL
jgi:hypothetical protein